MPLARTPIALTIAGSDSSGGAGIQADLKTFEALSVFGTTVLTAVTAQNTLAVSAVHDIPTAIVKAQLQAVLSDLPPSAIKIGMVSTVPVIRLLATLLPPAGVPIVLDPVMVAKSGVKLLRATSFDALKHELLPIASLVTPNLPEASALAGFPIRGEKDAKAAARIIQSMGPRAILIKGGHAEGDVVVDGLLDGRTWRRFEGPRQRTAATHGTGCTLSSAIASYLARGETLEDAVEKGIAFVRRAIERAPGIGAGHGPLGHRAAGGG